MYISILIPLYNGVEFIEQSLSSIFNQTYKNYEIIIGINGHNDNIVKDIVDNIVNEKNKEGKYDIVVKNYTTLGKSNTLNEMVKDSKYNHIALLDVDDYWVLNKLELQVPFIEKYDVVGGRCEYFGNKKGSPNIPLGDFSKTHNIFSYNPIINSSVIIKKEYALWEDVNYVKSNGLEDYNLWFKLFYKNCSFYNINDVLCYHRIHEKSAFNNHNNENVNELVCLWYDYYNKRR